MTAGVRLESFLWSRFASPQIDVLVNPNTANPLMTLEGLRYAIDMGALTASMASLGLSVPNPAFELLDGSPWAPYGQDLAAAQRFINTSCAHAGAAPEKLTLHTTAATGSGEEAAFVAAQLASLKNLTVVVV